MKIFDAINQLSNDGPLTLKVDGECMTACVPHGSSVQIEPRSFYWPGDIVVYGRGDDRLVMHRFLGYVPGRRGWCGVTRADEGHYADAPVPVGRILGKVMLIDQAPSAPGTLLRIRSFIRYVVAIVFWTGRVLVRAFKINEVFKR